MILDDETIELLIREERATDYFDLYQKELQDEAKTYKLPAQDLLKLDSLDIDEDEKYELQELITNYQLPFAPIESMITQGKQYHNISKLIEFREEYNFSRNNQDKVSLENIAYLSQFTDNRGVEDIITSIEMKRDESELDWGVGEIIFYMREQNYNPHDTSKVTDF